MTASFRTPLLSEQSTLDDRSKSLIAGLFDGEQQLMATMHGPSDHKRRQRLELTLPEILEQPAAIRTTLDRERQSIAAAARAIAGAGTKRIYMTGCGDSLASMIAVRALYEELLGIPCEPVQALDMAYYYHHTLGPDCLLVTLSSSGTTTRTVEALMMGKAKGARTLALSNTPGSPLMLESDHRLTVHAERKGWPTQASTAAMALLCQLALDIAKEQRLAVERVTELQQALDAIPDQIAETIALHERELVRIAEHEASRALFLFTGGGPSYAAALFGAAKVRECSPDHAFSIPIEEFHHYNSLKQGDPLFLVAPAGPSLPRARDTAEEGRRWGGHIYALVTGDETMLDHCAHSILRLPSVPEVLSALVYTIPVQLFAYHLAMAKGRAAERTSHA